MSKVYRKTTTKDIQEVVRLRKEEQLCDREIVRRTGIDPGTVRRIRNMYGLAPGKEGHRGQTRRKIYAFYDRKTTQFLCEGTIPECAAALGMSVKSMHPTIHRARNGIGPYEVYEVEE